MMDLPEVAKENGTKVGFVDVADPFVIDIVTGWYV